MRPRGAQSGRRPSPGLVAGLLLGLLVLTGVTSAGRPSVEILPTDPDTREENRAYRLLVDADARQRDWLGGQGYDISGFDLEANRVEVLTDQAGLERLRLRGLTYEILESRPPGLMGDPGPAAAGRPPTTDDPLPDQAYTDPLEMEAYLTQVAADHPGITRLEAIGTSIGGRTIWALMISDNAAADEDELAILLNSAHHGREVMTPEVLIDLIDHLTDGYGVDPQLTAHVDNYQIWTVPMVNPDGVDVVFTTDRWWRKNLRDNDDNGSITWKDGVDVNRNYEWGFGGQCVGSSESGSDATYRGEFEGSEPEAATMIALGRRVKPVFYVEFHSYGEDVFYSLGCDPTLSPALSTVTGPDQSIARVVAEDYSAQIVQADGQAGFIAAPYGNRVDGIGRDQHAHDSGAISFVTEVNAFAEGGFQPDFATWRDATVLGQRPGWLWLLDRIAGPAVGGHVIDAVTGQPLQANLTLDEMTLADGRRLTSRATSGRFHIIVVPGNYTLRVNAAGYEDADVPLTVGNTWQPIQVALQPDGSDRILLEEFEDPLSFATWSTSDADDDGRGGLWEWGDPLATYDGDLPNLDLVLGNPPLDHTPGGNHAFVTGNDPADGFTKSDVDAGVVTLTSPAFDLDGRYAVELGWHLWFYKEDGEPLDTLELELSDDGGTNWIPAASTVDRTTGLGAAQAWERESVRIDDFVAPGPDVRARFRVTDGGSDTIVEAAIDDLEIRGFSLTTDGALASLGFTEAGGLDLVWEAIPGASDAVVHVARGDLLQLAGGGSTVDLGPLTCLGSSMGGTTFALDPLDVPPPGSTWFYLARFTLGLTESGWGNASDGAIRSSGSECP